MMRIFLFMVALLALGLAGCSTNRTAAGGRIYTNRGEPCPSVGVLADAERLTDFYGAGRDLPDMRYEARITNVSIRCSHDRRWGGRRYVYSNIRLNFTASLGSAAQARPITIPYFVAVVVPETQQILIKEVYTITAQFSSDGRNLVLQDTVDRISIPVETPEEGGDFEILVGFDLTPEQLAFNRRQD